MQQWQQWMQAGQQAYQQAQWQAAIRCYDAALADVWPIWWHSIFVCNQPPALSGCAAHAGQPAAQTPDWTLPTRCLVTTVRNLAWCYRCNAEPALAHALLQQTQRWLHSALQQQELPLQLQQVLLQQHADLQTDLWPASQPESVLLH